MKRVSLLFSAFLMVGMLFSTQVMGQATITLNGAKSAQKCLNTSDEGLTATFSFGSIDATEVATERGVFSNITMDGTYPSGNIGDPTLPVANKLIALPIGVSNVNVQVKNYSTEVYNLADYGIHNLYPQQTPLRKDQRPEDVPFEYNAKAYSTPGFVERPIAMFEIKGTMRGIQIGALTINPVQYDAVNNLVRVYNNIEVEVNYGQYDKAAAYNEFERTFNPYFAGVYKAMFNERQLRDIYDEHPDMWQNPVKMLVITNRAFESTIQDWVTWKTEKGFYVDVNYTDDIGSNAAAIKTFIQQKYATDAPTFLMIMGDKNMVPESANGSETHCVTDIQYSSVDGDMFSDMFHSRFPAENVAQMTAMLNKALEYEQLTMPDPSYLSNVLLIAGEDSGWGVTVGRPTIWYATTNYYNTEHGFNNVYEFSHGTYTNCYSYLNTGVGFVNYTAHGSNTSWSGPSFTVSDVHGLTNEHKYFLAMGNCCQAADWGISSECYGEAMVRAENKAAYAYIGSCPSTYWLNDYYFGVGATSRADGTMPAFEETTMGCYDAIWTEDAYNVVDAIRFVGNLASNAAEALSYTLHISNLYDWQAYHTLGDGSILPYRVQPVENNVSHMPTLPIGVPTYTIEAEPGSYVGITKDGVLYGAGMIGAEGAADITLEPITSGGDVKIVVTNPKCVPYIATIPAAAMDNAYVTVDSYEMVNASQANYNDTIDLNITLKNVGILPSGNITATLTTECSYIEILSNTSTANGLNPDQTATMEGFQFSVNENVPDKTKAKFILSVSNGNDTWEGKFTIELHAAGLAFMGIEDEETERGKQLKLTYKNTGSAAFYGGTLDIYSSSPFLTFDEENITFDNVVEGGEQLVLVAPYTVDATQLQDATSIEITHHMTTGLLTASDNYIYAYNTFIEDFESGEFNNSWTTTATYPWTIVEDGRGNHYAKSGGWHVDNAVSSCELVVDVVAEGNMTFRYKVSSEGSSTNQWDNLKFFMDGVQKAIWSGTSMTDFATFEQPVTVGQHTFTWTYSKDYSVNSGDDCALIDDIIFPMVENIRFIRPAHDLEAEVQGSDVVLTWGASIEATSYLVKRDGVLIGTVTEPTFTDAVESDGDYVYAVYAADDNHQISTPVKTTVNFVFDAADESHESRISVYPNPANSFLNIVVSGNFEYRLYNSTGQEVATGVAQGVKQINVSNFSKGVYFLQLTTGSKTDTQKIVVE